MRCEPQKGYPLSPTHTFFFGDASTLGNFDRNGCNLDGSQNVQFFVQLYKGVPMLLGRRCMLPMLPWSFIMVKELRSQWL